MKVQKVIIFIVTIILLIYIIRVALFTRKRWEYKTYAFGIMIFGLSLLSVATFFDMVANIILFEYRYTLIKFCFFLGGVTFTLGVMLWSDYTKKIIERFEKISMTDYMTGVFNRNGVEKIFLDFCQDNKSFYVLLCDLDKTKKINDSYGHVYGDEYIKSAVGIMEDAIKHKGYLGRIGGDEFIILLDFEDEELLINRINEIKKNVSEIFQDDGIGISIGYSAFPMQGKDLNQLILLADKRMYEDKHRYNKQLQFEYI